MADFNRRVAGLISLFGTFYICHEYNSLYCRSAGEKTRTLHIAPILFNSSRGTRHPGIQKMTCGVVIPRV